MNKSPLDIPGLQRPSVNFDAVRDGRRTLPLYFDLDLSTARSVAAGTAAVLPIAGNSFYSDPIVDASGNDVGGLAVIHFQDTTLGATPTPFTVRPSFQARVPFTQLLIENPAQAGKTLRIIYGVDLDFQPGLGAQVSILGSVSVTDAALDRALAGSAFQGNVALGAGGGTYPHLQLWNPAASGVNVIVRRWQMTTNTTQKIELRESAAAIATLYGSGTNKKMGGAGSAAKFYTEANAAPLGANIGLSPIVQVNWTPYVMPVFDVLEPWVIGPGTGLIIRGQALASTMYADFEWEERAI